MKADDPVLYLIPPERRPSLMQFFQTGVPDKRLQRDMNTRVQSQFSLIIRARYEEDCLYTMHQYLRIRKFLETLDPAIHRDILQYFITEEQPPRLAEYLDRYEKVETALYEFVQREQIRSRRWREQIDAMSDGSLDQAMALTRRFQRLRQLWSKASRALDPPTLNLVDPAKQDAYHVFIANGIADESFTEFLRMNYFCLEAVKIQVVYEERLLYISSFDRRLEKFVGHFAPAWRDDVRAYYTARMLRPEFIEFLNKNTADDELLTEFFEAEDNFAIAEREKHIGIMRLPGSPETVKALSSLLRDIRRRWIKERLRHIV